MRWASAEVCVYVCVCHANILMPSATASYYFVSFIKFKSNESFFFFWFLFVSFSFSLVFQAPILIIPQIWTDIWQMILKHKIHNFYVKLTESYTSKRKKENREHNGRIKKWIEDFSCKTHVFILTTCSLFFFFPLFVHFSSFNLLTLLRCVKVKTKRITNGWTYTELFRVFLLSSHNFHTKTSDSTSLLWNRIKFEVRKTTENLLCQFRKCFPS